MSNRKIFIYILFGIFLISLFSAAYFSYLLWLKPKIQADIEVKPVTSFPGDSIVKYVSDERKAVTYEIEGEFISDLEKSGETNLLTGGFVVKGDISNNTIAVYMGTLDGNIFLGRYSDSFMGKSSWDIVPTDTLFQSIKTGDPVKLSIEYSSSEATVAVNSLDKAQDILDRLTSAIKSGDKYNVPADFSLVTNKIGIIE